MTGSKLVVVVGETGGQGGSVIEALLGSDEYTIRGVTRNPSSDKSKTLIARGVEMVMADVSDHHTLIKAFEGAYAVFGVTDYMEQLITLGPAKAQQAEHEQARNIAKAASATRTLEHYIWSTIPSAMAISGGKWDVPHFESKAAADEYILKELPNLAKKTTFLWVGYYASNVKAPAMAPTYHATSKKHLWLSPIAHTTILTSVGSPAKNVGLFVSAILAQPQRTLPARYVMGGVETLTMGQVIEGWGRVTEQPMELVKIDAETFDRLFPGWSAITRMLQFWEEYGDKSFSKEGFDVLTKSDLGLEDSQLTLT